jgi:hypothetical protein
VVEVDDDLAQTMDELECWHKLLPLRQVLQASNLPEN